MLKKISFGILLIFMVLLFTSFTDAQTTRTEVADGNYIISSSNIGYLDGTGTVYTEPFVVADQDAFSWVTYPWTYSITGTVPTTGTIKARMYLQASFSNSSNFTDIDTITVASDILSTTPAEGTFDMNNKKYPYYRWKFVGQSGNADSVTVTVKLWNPKKE